MVAKGRVRLPVCAPHAKGNAVPLRLAVAGVYAANLYGSNGQLINSEIISHAGGTATKTIRPAAALNSGTYQLEITSPDNKVTVIKIMVNKNY